MIKQSENKIKEDSDETAINEILRYIKVLKKKKCLRIGTNVSIKSLDRGESLFIIVSKDTEPFEIVKGLIRKAELQNTPYMVLENGLKLLPEIVGVRTRIAALSITNAKDDAHVFDICTKLEDLTKKIQH